MKNRPFFEAGRGFPGEQLDMKLKEVQKIYRESGKLYGQNDQLSAGTNSNLIVNLPQGGRMLCGISQYYNYQDANENPTMELEINNGIVIRSTGIRVFDIATLRERMYYPIFYPLSGNDTIKMSISGVVAQKNLFTNWHYV